MTLENMRALLTRRPFEPLCVKLSSGEIFEIRHPEMATLTRTGLIVVLPDAEGEPSERFEVSVETATTASGPRLG